MPEQSPPPAAGNLTDEVRRALELQASGKPADVVAAEQAQIDEWSEWVAVQPIDYGGVRALNIGDAVPKANVEKYKYDELGWVAKRSTKAGKAAVASVTGSES